MRRGGGIGVLTTLFAVGALAAGRVTATAAGSHASPASVLTLHLKLRDQVFVKGTPIACVVQTSAGTVNFACVKGSLANPVAHSYAVGIADKGADLAAVSGSSAKLIKLVSEPAVSGATFVVRAGPPRRFTVAPTAALLIGGTHIFCAVEFAAGARNVTCGLSTLALGLQFPAGSYITSESATFSLLAKAEPKGKFQTVAAKSQP